jgi:hypothetical protein
MPIDRMLNGLGPKERDILKRAFDQTLRSLYLVDRNDPVCEIVAQKIIAIGATGIRDAAEISKRAVKELGPP